MSLGTLKWKGARLHLSMIACMHVSMDVYIHTYYIYPLHLSMIVCIHVSMDVYILTYYLYTAAYYHNSNIKLGKYLILSCFCTRYVVNFYLISLHGTVKK